MELLPRANGGAESGASPSTLLMPSIRLGRSSCVALVDEADYAAVSRYSWCLSGRYVRGRVNGKHISLHQFLLGKKDGMVIDHIDRDPCNCRRDNLRHVTPDQNAANSEHRMRKTNALRGTRQIPGSEKHEARVGEGGRKRYGPFRTPVAAGMIRDIAALDEYKGCTNLNFPELRELFDVLQQRALGKDGETPSQTSTVAPFGVQ